MHIPIDLGDPVNSLLDTFGAPVCSERFCWGIINSLIQSFPFCQCNLVLVPWTHNALLTIDLLCSKNIRTKQLATKMNRMHQDFAAITTKSYATYLNVSTLQWPTWVCCGKITMWNILVLSRPKLNQKQTSTNLELTVATQVHCMKTTVVVQD